AAEGVRMVAVARSRDALEELARELPGTVIPAAADIRDPAAVDGVRDLALDRLGHVDILVNNAGVGHFGLIEEFTPEQWDEMFAVNLKGAYLMCRSFVPHMKERRSGHPAPGGRGRGPGRGSGSPGARRRPGERRRGRPLRAH